MKKLLIALLGINALLIALLTAQASQAAWTKSEKATVTALERRIQQLEQLAEENSSSYDAVQLLRYEKCLHFKVLTAAASGIGETKSALYFMLSDCAYLEP